MAGGRRDWTGEERRMRMGGGRQCSPICTLSRRFAALHDILMPLMLPVFVFRDRSPGTGIQAK